jgi:hypothetical protein
VSTNFAKIKNFLTSSVLLSGGRFFGEFYEPSRQQNNSLMYVNDLSVYVVDELSYQYMWMTYCRIGFKAGNINRCKILFVR